MKVSVPALVLFALDDAALGASDVAAVVLFRLSFLVGQDVPGQNHEPKAGIEPALHALQACASPLGHNGIAHRIVSR